jgi:hypothetical protein
MKDQFMQTKPAWPVRFFLCSAGMLLILTGAAKLISAAGSARILQMPDPLLMIPFGYVFWIAGITEILVAFVCFFSNRTRLSAGLVAWLATTFLIYRIGLLCLGSYKLCGCLGNLTDAVHISPQTADLIAKTVLGYLLIGSYATIFHLRRPHSRNPIEPGLPTDSLEGA